MPHIFSLPTILPEIFVLTMACVVLLCDAFTPKGKPSSTYVLTQITMIGASILTLAHFADPKVIMFNGLFVEDNLSKLLKLMIYGTGFFSFWYARDYIRARQIPEGEYYTLSLFSILGMMVLVSGHNLFLTFKGRKTSYASLIVN